MLEMVLLPDPRLHQSSHDISVFDKDLQDFCEQMVLTMREGQGIGLAGVQVGRMENLFVVQVEEKGPLVFINPRIISYSDSLVPYEEGCLSIPGVYAEVMRPDSVQIQACDPMGKEFTMETDGILARVVQHEYDHLVGKLFYEYLKPGQQKRLLKQYETLQAS